MFPGQRKRGWRQCLADSYEKNHGPLRFDEEPVVELSCSDNDTDDEGSVSFRDSMREVRIRVYASAGIDIVAVEAKRRARRLAGEKRREARAAESNGTKSALPSSHDHATKPSSTTEADNAEYQAKHKKRKR
ncbi:hypothetical protein FPHYL_3021 [Fusarium phyllophilum]|uniref:Uncharacterized protein n=1 Tax=Fusarium phyllophilum TaxID=47803 RepID=A0A8H5K6X4_9HYPO|nr:hypothetical protein FPHYL_3021 [Fusarium phyllophilum]